LLEKSKESTPLEREGNFPRKLFALRSIILIDIGFVKVVLNSPWI